MSIWLLLSSILDFWGFLLCLIPKWSFSLLHSHTALITISLSSHHQLYLWFVHLLFTSAISLKTMFCLHFTCWDSWFWEIFSLGLTRLLHQYGQHFTRGSLFNCEANHLGIRQHPCACVALDDINCGYCLRPLSLLKSLSGGVFLSKEFRSETFRFWTMPLKYWVGFITQGFLEV